MIQNKNKNFFQIIKMFLFLQYLCRQIILIQLKNHIQMSYDDDYDCVPEELDEGSLSRAFQKMELKQYKDFKRPKLVLKEDQVITCMNIDISPAVRNDTFNKKQIPIVRIYAVTQQGNSLQIQVQGFYPYFYSDLPRHLPPNLTQQKLNQIRIKINAHFTELQKQKKRKYNTPINQQAIIRIQYVQKKNIRFYVPDQNSVMTYWKITTSVPGVVNALRKMFQEQVYVQGIQMPRQTYQSNIPYVLRFMIDRNIVGMGWIQVDNYKIIRQESESELETKNQSVAPKCQLQISCNCQDISQKSSQMKMPPLRVLSFDIQCAAQHGFPDPLVHQVIQIACVCKTSDKQEQDYRVVFTLHGTDKISGVHVKSSDKQQDLLLNFEKLMITYDPDFITGYNMVNFDLWYILERAKALRMQNYGIFGRSKGVLSKIRNSTFQSKVMGNRQTKQINIDGRIQLDMLIHMHRQHKLSSYRLNSVAYEILNDQKQDVHHTQIYKLFKTGPETRKRLAVYCIKDAQLPLRLMQKLCCLFNYSEMARVTGVPINFLLNRGQQIKVMSQLLRKSQHLKYICPTERVRKNDGQVGYQGAYVLDPQVGYYDDPIATLDFASLYPSIMIAHNLCYTTLVRADQLMNYKIDPGLITTTPQKFSFVHKKVREGILPQILVQLLAARKRAKNDLKKQTDPMMRSVLQGRQLALKISANSVYGFTGALVGQLPCLQISASVTGFGRQMIQNTRDKVIQLFPGSQVIYGDTDSVMVKFKLFKSLQTNGTNKQIRTAKIQQAMEFGRIAASQVTSALFKGMDPIKLEFEKVYCPYLLMAKKRYAGLYFSSSAQKHDKIDKKGIESVRRDNCVLIRRMLEMVLKLVLQQSDNNGPSRAVQYIKQQVSLLVQNKIDISQLVISKGITKKVGQQQEQQDNKKGNKSKGSQNTYKVRQAHVQLAQKMKKRDENINVSIGDRISYVMINGQKGSRNYQNAQNPLMVLNENLPIDFDYYINKQIKPPLERLLKKTKIIENFDMLFCGQHTRNRYIPKIGKSNFLSKFVQKKQTCINCPTVTELDLCQRCQGKRLQIYLKKQDQFLRMNKQYNDYWQQCVNCQGSNYNQILCKNEDCPIFYRRIKVRNDLQQKRKQFERFRWYW